MNETRRQENVKGSDPLQTQVGESGHKTGEEGQTDRQTAVTGRAKEKAETLHVWQQSSLSLGISAGGLPKSLTQGPARPHMVFRTLRAQLQV